MARRLLTSDTAPQAATDGGTGADAPSQAPHVRWDLHGSAVKVAIAGNVVFAALFFVAIIWRIFFSGTGQEGAPVAPRAPGANGAAARASSSGASTSYTSPRARGLRKDDLLALPVFVHISSVEESGGGEGKVECAVCISELRDGDTGRLLPRCRHRFHSECVDRWFRSNVTCPLCRAVVADGCSGKPDPKVQPGS